MFLAVIPELAVECANESILSGLARLNELQFYAESLAPQEHCLASHFGTFVHLRLPIIVGGLPRDYTNRWAVATSKFGVEGVNCG